MEPHVDFFRWLFSGQTLSAGDPPEAAPVGGFALQKKPSAGGSYPAYIPCHSNRNPVEVPFPAFTDGRPEKQDSWSWGYSHWEKKKVEIIEEEL